MFPDKVAPHSDKQAWRKCKTCGNIWKSKIDSRTRCKAGCPECAKKIISESKMIPVVCVETGKEYSSIQDAESSTGINRHGISHCCKGDQMTAGGYHWRYAKSNDK